MIKYDTFNYYKIHRSAITLKPQTGKVSNASHFYPPPCSVWKTCIRRGTAKPCKNSSGRAKKHVKEPEVSPRPLNPPDTNLMGSESICGKPVQFTKILPPKPTGPKESFGKVLVENTPGHLQMFLDHNFWQDEESTLCIRQVVTMLWLIGSTIQCNTIGYDAILHDTIMWNAI